MVGAIASIAALVQGGTCRPRNVYQHQPAKLAAFEALFNSGPADLHLFGIPGCEGPGPFITTSLSPAESASCCFRSGTRR